MKYILGASKFLVSLFTDKETYQIASFGMNPNPDILSITTNKDLASGAGTWSIEFTPKKDRNGLTWFDKIDIFSYVEIQFKGIKDSEQKMVMRGIVDRISIAESFTAGVPNRRIILEGRDLGGLLQDIGVYWIPEIDPVAYEIGMLNWKEIAEKNPGVELNIEEVFDMFKTQFLKAMDLNVGKDGKIKIKDKFDLRAKSFNPDAKTTWIHLIKEQGPWWDFFSYYQDKPFNELFLYDDDLNTRFICRPSRLKDASGKYHKSVDITDKIMYPPDFKINDKEIMSQTFNKSIDGLYSYYVTVPETLPFNGLAIRSINYVAAGHRPHRCKNPFLVIDRDYPSCVKKYGYRPLEGKTVFSDTDPTGKKAKEKGQTVEEYTKQKLGIADVDDMNMAMVSWFVYNPLLVFGTITIPGTNRALIGTYAMIADKEKGKENMEFYVEGVTHTFVINESFTTSLRLTRGQQTDGGLLKSSEKVKKFVGFETGGEQSVVLEGGLLATKRYI